MVAAYRFVTTPISVQPQGTSCETVRSRQLINSNYSSIPNHVLEY